MRWVGTLCRRLYRKAYIGGEEDFPGNCATGQLTSLGYVQQLNNGAALRDAYVSGNGSGATVDAFLPAAINFTGAADWFRLRSDDSSRTIKSGQALFEGLYPPALVNGASEVVQWWTMSESRVRRRRNRHSPSILLPLLTHAPLSRWHGRTG